METWPRVLRTVTIRMEHGKGKGRRWGSAGASPYHSKVIRVQSVFHSWLISATDGSYGRFISGGALREKGYQISHGEKFD